MYLPHWFEPANVKLTIWLWAKRSCVDENNWKIDIYIFWCNRMEWWRHSSALWPVLIWKKHRKTFSTSVSCIWTPNDYSISIGLRAIHSGQFWTLSASLCGGPRPATRSIRRPVGTQQTGLFVPLRGQAQCAHNIDGRGMLMFYSHDEKSYVG